MILRTSLFACTKTFCRGIKLKTATPDVVKGAVVRMHAKALLTQIVAAVIDLDIGPGMVAPHTRVHAVGTVPGWTFCASVFADVWLVKVDAARLAFVGGLVALIPRNADAL